MKSKIKVFIASLLAIFSFAPMMAPVAMAQNTDPGNSLACGATINLAINNTGCTVAANADSRVNNIIRTAIRLFQLVVGIISVVMIIIGGLKYITSGGDSGSVGSAKNTILYALVGIAVVALAEIVVQFVLNRVTSANSQF